MLDTARKIWTKILFDGEGCEFILAAFSAQDVQIDYDLTQLSGDSRCKPKERRAAFPPATRVSPDRPSRHVDPSHPTHRRRVIAAMHYEAVARMMGARSRPPQKVRRYMVLITPTRRSIMTEYWRGEVARRRHTMRYGKSQIYALSRRLRCFMTWCGMKRVAIVQSNYIPWKGYFDMIQQADHFVLYDDVQFNKYNWRNRNRIKTRNGLQWLTIPVIQSSLRQTIQDTKIADPRWMKKHWHALEHNYARAKCFSSYRDLFAELYLTATQPHLSDINLHFLKGICRLLEIKTEISFSRQYDLGSGRIERVVNLCQQLNASVFLVGPAAKPYINEPLFREAGIQLEWMTYHGYPPYHQLFCPPFAHEVTILDLLFNVGAEQAWKFMLSKNKAGLTSSQANLTCENS